MPESPRPFISDVGHAFSQYGVTDLQQEHTMLWNAVDAVI